MENTVTMTNNYAEQSIYCIWWVKQRCSLQSWKTVTMEEICAVLGVFICECHCFECSEDYHTRLNYKVV
jgi:hypothetical protein